VDEAKLEQFMGKAVTDMAAAMTLLLMAIGDKLGIYKAMAGAGAMTAEQVATKTGLTERYVREWLGNQVASGYVEYDPTKKRYTLPDEHAFALADEESPVFLGGAFDVFGATWAAEDKIAEAFQTGKGVGWHEHHPRLFRGTERFFRPGYKANLTAAWIPALKGVEKQLNAGAAVADVGCGHGASTILLAKTYPNSTFAGFDYHSGSIAEASKRAAEAGVADRVSFEVATAQSFPGTGFDLVATFDCLHDMGDPVGAARHIRESLASDGTWLIVEPAAGATLSDNLNPVGRIYYGFSTFLCVPNALSQPGGYALGAQAGANQIGDVVTEGGFTRFRQSEQTPFNLVFEGRP
jgi:SAM-dependent methyltransferase